MQHVYRADIGQNAFETVQLAYCGVEIQRIGIKGCDYLISVTKCFTRLFKVVEN